MELEQFSRSEKSVPQQVVASLETYLDESLAIDAVSPEEGEHQKFVDTVSSIEGMDRSVVERVHRRMQLSAFADQLVLMHIRTGRLPEIDEFKSGLESFITTPETVERLLERYTQYTALFQKDAAYRKESVQHTPDSILEKYRDTPDHPEIGETIELMKRIQVARDAGTLQFLEGRRTNGFQPESIEDYVSIAQLPFADIVILRNLDYSLNEGTIRLALNVEVSDDSYEDIIQRPNGATEGWGQITLPLYHKAFGEAWAYSEANAHGRYLVVVPEGDIQNAETFNTLLLHEYKHVLHNVLFFDRSHIQRPDKDTTRYSPSDADRYLIHEFHAQSFTSQLQDTFRLYVSEIEHFFHENVKNTDDAAHDEWKACIEKWKSIQSIITKYQEDLKYLDVASVLHYAISLAENVDDVLDGVSVTVGYIRSVAEESQATS